MTNLNKKLFTKIGVALSIITALSGLYTTGIYRKKNVALHQELEQRTKETVDTIESTELNTINIVVATLEELQHNSSKVFEMYDTRKPDSIYEIKDYILTIKKDVENTNTRIATLKQTDNKNLYDVMNAAQDGCLELNNILDKTIHSIDTLNVDEFSDSLRELQHYNDKISNVLTEIKQNKAE